MSFVSHVTVTTMCAGAACAMRCAYSDGAAVGSAVAVAGVAGTSVSVEDLFYNVVTRRKALKGASEEYARVLEVVQRYSLLRTDVAFSVRKQGEARSDLHTPPCARVEERVRCVFGAGLARELLSFSARSGEAEAGAGAEGGAGRATFQLEGLASGPGYGAKRGTFILFINGRLVESAPLRAALEAVYAQVLPRAEKPWLFLALRLPPAHVDVNVHPTKAEVAFLHADQLAGAAAAALQRVLEAANGERSFAPGAATQAQAQTQGGASLQARRGSAAAAATATAAAAAATGEGGGASGTQRERAGGDHKLVRTDAAAGSLDAFLRRPSAGGDAQLQLGRGGRGQEGEGAEGGLDEARRNVRARRGSVGAQAQAAERDAPCSPPAPAAPRAPSPPPCELTSVAELLSECERASHAGLAEVFRRHTFVGLANGSLALLQHGTRLYMAHVPRASRELFTQLALRRFGRHAALTLSPPAPLAPLLREALVEAQRRGEGAVERDQLAEAAQALAQLLLNKGPMLREYFALHVADDGCGGALLCTLPALLEEHSPEVAALPEFLLRLAKETRWQAEKDCFQDVAGHLGELYAMYPPAPAQAAPAEPDAGAGAGSGAPCSSAAEQAHEWAVAHLLFPALRTHLRPPAPFAADGTVLQVACLEQLYRVFERC